MSSQARFRAQVDLSTNDRELIRQALLRDPRAWRYLEAVVLRRLDEGVSGARVFEVEWLSGESGSSDFSVVKLDSPERLAQEVRFSRKYGVDAPSFLSVEAPGFDPDNPPASGLGCIVYQHAQGLFPGPFQSLTALCREALASGEEALDRAGESLRLALRLIEQQLRRGTSAHQERSPLAQQDFYRQRWYPAAVLEARHARFEGGTLFLELRDDDPEATIDPGRDPEADLSWVGKVVSTWGSDLVVQGDRVFVNIPDEACFQVEKVPAAEIRSALSGSVPERVSISGRLKNVSLSFYNDRFQTIGLDAAAASLPFGDLSVANPLIGWHRRLRAWSERKPRPTVAVGHGDFHGGNILCGPSGVAIIDHAHWGPEQPSWADAARLLGSLWREVYAPTLTREEMVRVLRGAVDAEAGSPVALAARFLYQGIRSALEVGPKGPAAQRELWIDLHHFAWIGLKWPGSEGSHAAMIALAAEAVVRVEAIERLLEAERRLHEVSGAYLAPSGMALPSVVSNPQALFDVAFKLDEGDPHRSISWKLRETIRATLSIQGDLLEVEASPEEGILGYLLDKALAGAWDEAAFLEAGEIRQRHGLAGAKARNRVLLAGILFFACLRGGGKRELDLLIDLALDGDEDVEKEAVFLLVRLLAAPRIWEFLGGNQRFEKRLDRVFSDPRWFRLALAVEEAEAQVQVPDLLGIFGDASMSPRFPRALWLLPFDALEDVSLALRAASPPGFWALIQGSISLTAVEKHALVRRGQNLSDYQVVQLSEILRVELESFRGFDSDLLWVHRRSMEWLVCAAHLTTGEQALEEGSREFGRTFAELISDSGQRNLAKGRMLSKRANEAKDRGVPTEALDLYRQSSEAFSVAESLEPNDDALWAFVLGCQADLCPQDPLNEADLRKQAIERYRAAVRAKPDLHEALFNWGYQLGELARLSAGDPGEEKRLREEAIERYRDAVGVKPDKHEALNNWGWQLDALARLSAGDPVEEKRLREEAIERYRAAVEAKPDKHQALFNWGNALDALACLSAGDPVEERRFREEAIERYRAAVGVKRDKHEALHNWGCQLGALARLSAGDPGEAKRLREEAIERYRAAVEAKRDLDEALLNWGNELSRLALSAGDPGEEKRLREEAIERYRAAVGVKPDKLEALFNWGWQLGELARLSAGDPGEEKRLREEAIERYRAAIGVKPDLHEALYNWGNELGQLARLNAGDPGEEKRRREEAIERYRAAVGVKPDLHEALYNWGWQLGELARLSASDPGDEKRLREEAIERYRAAVWVKPDLHEALHNWGWQLGQLAHLSAGDPGEEKRLREEAIERYRAAVGVKPDKHEALDNWAGELCRLSAGQPDQRAEALRQASDLLERAAALRGVPVTRVYNFACTLALRGERDPALESLEECLKEGTIEAAHVREDGDWLEFRDDPAWKSLLDRYPRV